ncbi:MAG: electron transfer flavoprotein subunit alpha/FixB family protein [bacterium]|nr:electron transfer flavoprotein subunit alpha/FixB family protein [bacterium]
MNNKKILLIIETINNKPIASTIELINFSRILSPDNPDETGIIVSGSSIKETAAELAQSTGMDVLALENEHLEYYNYDILSQIISGLMQESSPKYICLLHTMQGSQTGAFIAEKAGMRYLTSVDSCSVKEKKPVFTRSVFNGKMKMNTGTEEEPAVITLEPGAFALKKTEPEIPEKSPGIMELQQPEMLPRRYVPLGYEEPDEKENPIEEAEVIVAAGRGIGKEENLELVKQAVTLFKNSAIGASRAICDRDWLPYSCQVGITGKTVTPRLYLACGISGAGQHISGMKNSQMVISINNDPDAAIFSISDYIIVENLAVFLPLFINKYHESSEKEQ